VINVGAGTGNYEPREGSVLAVEPSATMLAQRAPGAAPAVRGVAESLPVPDLAFDAALAVLTVHHWTDPRRGLAELRRVAPRQVVVTWDPVPSSRHWLHRDYLPELVAHEAAQFSLAGVVAALDVTSVHVLEVPRGCVDGFLSAQWATPAELLDPAVRAGMSGLSLLDQDVVRDAMDRLARDLEDGTWQRRNAELATIASLDTGFRLVVAGAQSAWPRASTSRPKT
jgi:SAM-dependent methyltransferase